MRNNETGEFELVVGNRQLLSGFAIVVLLFGVGVAMGYFLGQNSPRSAKLQPDAASVPPPCRIAAAAGSPRPHPQEQAAPPAAATVDAAAAAPAGAPSEAAPPTATQPVREPSGAAPATQAPAVAATSPMPEAPPGTYWQVMALRKRMRKRWCGLCRIRASRRC